MVSISSSKTYKCKDCIYYYDPRKGEPSQKIKPGTPFESIPESWVCPICKASKRRLFPDYQKQGLISNSD